MLYDHVQNKMCVRGTLEYKNPGAEIETRESREQNCNGIV